MKHDTRTGDRHTREARDRENARKRAVRAQRGPSDAPAIPEGHELAGMSTLTGPDGAVKGAWAKTRIHGADAPPTAVPETHHVKRTATLQRGDGTTVAHEKAREDAMVAAWARHASLYAGLAGTAPWPEVTNADLCTLYPLGDPHVGMLAWAPETGTHHDLAIATRELMACMRELVASAPPSERAIVCNLGDFLHAQDDSNVTPGHGNMLDVDGRFAKVLDAGHALLRGIVDAALRRHARVTVRNLPGNHDPRVAAELSMWLRAVYEHEPRVDVADAFRSHVRGNAHRLAPRRPHAGERITGYHGGGSVGRMGHHEVPRVAHGTRAPRVVQRVPGVRRGVPRHSSAWRRLARHTVQVAPAHERDHASPRLRGGVPRGRRDRTRARRDARRVVSACAKAPAGWTCSRHAGHQGPCAAVSLDGVRAETFAPDDILQELATAYVRIGALTALLEERTRELAEARAALAVATAVRP